MSKLKFQKTMDHLMDEIKCRAIALDLFPKNDHPDIVAVSESLKQEIEEFEEAVKILRNYSRSMNWEDN